MIRSEAWWNVIASGALNWTPSRDSVITIAFAESFRFDNVYTTESLPPESNAMLGLLAAKNDCPPSERLSPVACHVFPPSALVLIRTVPEPLSLAAMAMLFGRMGSTATTGRDCGPGPAITPRFWLVLGLLKIDSRADCTAAAPPGI